MGAIVGKILLQVALFLLPALENWIRAQLQNPPPPNVPPELHDSVSVLLPVKSASAEMARKLREEQSKSS